jgi:hypothetical protein
MIQSDGRGEKPDGDELLEVDSGISMPTATLDKL